jgi:hypothetical protein
MYLTEYGGLTLHTYYLPPNEIIPSNIYIQFTTKSMGLTKAETILKRCKINKRKTVNAYDATYEIYENAKCGDSFNTEVDIYANNNMDYLISVPNTIDSDFLNSFLSTFKFYTQIPENLSGISPTPKLKLPKRILPTAGLQSKWNIYENEKFGFTISYPANWKRGLCSNGAKNWDVCI